MIFFFFLQRSQILGNRVEMEVADAINQNNTLLRLNLQFDTHGPRVRVTEKLKQNLDARKSSLLIVFDPDTLFRDSLDKPLFLSVEKMFYSFLFFSTQKTYCKQRRNQKINFFIL